MKVAGIFSKGIASFCGVGYLGLGAGTIAAIITCYIWYATSPDLVVQVIVVALVIALGIFSSNLVEPEWGKDNQKVVIDEVAGMSVSLLAIPIESDYILIGLTLFRLFDIAKPFYIRRMEEFKSGWGVMLDDILAGVYSNILLQIIVYFGILK